MNKNARFLLITIIGIVIIAVLFLALGIGDPTGSVISFGKCKKNMEICDGKDNNCNNKIDENLSIACTAASQCGTSGWSSSPYCGTDGNVHREWTTYMCQFPGTCSSTCASVKEDRIYQSCLNGCSNGACIISNSTTNSSQ
ncbi:hypothetical protein HYW75_00755 [Candidatus Pacearchaeota archaeon]|nr:hypothetical protein [Candidatus Pacearchaeota archaeon]